MSRGKVREVADGFVVLVPKIAELKRPFSIRRSRHGSALREGD